jgi:hypothetical protein
MISFSLGDYLEIHLARPVHQVVCCGIFSKAERHRPLAQRLYILAVATSMLLSTQWWSTASQSFVLLVIMVSEIFRILFGD